MKKTLYEELNEISEQAATNFNDDERKKIIFEYLTKELKEVAAKGKGDKVAIIKVNTFIENKCTLTAADVAEFSIANNLQYKFRKNFPDEVYVSWEKID